MKLAGRQGASQYSLHCERSLIGRCFCSRLAAMLHVRERTSSSSTLRSDSAAAGSLRVRPTVPPSDYVHNGSSERLHAPQTSSPLSLSSKLPSNHVVTRRPSTDSMRTVRSNSPERPRPPVPRGPRPPSHFSVRSSSGSPSGSRRSLSIARGPPSPEGGDDSPTSLKSRYTPNDTNGLDHEPKATVYATDYAAQDPHVSRSVPRPRPSTWMHPSGIPLPPPPADWSTMLPHSVDWSALLASRTRISAPTSPTDSITRTVTSLSPPDSILTLRAGSYSPRHETSLDEPLTSPNVPDFPPTVSNAQRGNRPLPSPPLSNGSIPTLTPSTSAVRPTPIEGAPPKVPPYVTYRPSSSSQPNPSNVHRGRLDSAGDAAALHDLPPVWPNRAQSSSFSSAGTVRPASNSSSPTRTPLAGSPRTSFANSTSTASRTPSSNLARKPSAEPMSSGYIPSPTPTVRPSLPTDPMRTPRAIPNGVLPSPAPNSDHRRVQSQTTRIRSRGTSSSSSSPRRWSLTSNNSGSTIVNSSQQARIPLNAPSVSPVPEFETHNGLGSLQERAQSALLDAPIFSQGLQPQRLQEPTIQPQSSSGTFRRFSQLRPHTEAPPAPKKHRKKWAMEDIQMLAAATSMVSKLIEMSTQISD